MFSEKIKVSLFHASLVASEFHLLRVRAPMDKLLVMKAECWAIASLHDLLFLRVSTVLTDRRIHGRVTLFCACRDGRGNENMTSVVVDDNIFLGLVVVFTIIQKFTCIQPFSS